MLESENELLDSNLPTLGSTSPFIMPPLRQTVVPVKETEKVVKEKKKRGTVKPTQAEKIRQIEDVWIELKKKEVDQITTVTPVLYERPTLKSETKEILTTNKKPYRPFFARERKIEALKEKIGTWLKNNNAELGEAEIYVLSEALTNKIMLGVSYDNLQEYFPK